MFKPKNNNNKKKQKYKINRENDQNSIIQLL